MNQSFIFKKYSNIGGIDAQQDTTYLTNCFVDTGQLELLKDVNSPQCIVLGRTGTGKTALVDVLASQVSNCIQLSPEKLSLSYLSNSEILKFLIEEVGLNMDLFFKTLWKHVFVVEILKKNFDLVDQNKLNIFLTGLRTSSSVKRSEEEAKHYLFKWEGSFWKDTDYHIKEFIQHVEKEAKISTKLGLQDILLPSNFEIGNTKKLSEEQKGEIRKLGRSIVPEEQLHELDSVIEYISKVLLKDEQKQIYITIDRLDEKWVNDNLRYRLIRSLIDSIKDINTRLHNAKIIMTLRKDLYETVYHYTKTPGEQEEKYTSLMLPLSWTKQELEIVLNRRINQLIKNKYTNSEVTIRDLLPKTINGIDSYEYIVNRTLLTPRDLISFFNKCIEKAEGKTTISEEAINEAEYEYSSSRMQALSDEWEINFPLLPSVSLFMKGYKSSFQYSEINQDLFGDYMMNFLSRNSSNNTTYETIKNYLENGLDLKGLFYEIIKKFYHMGIIGIQKDSTNSKVYWGYKNSHILDSEYTDDCVFFIHPAFWKYLCVKTQ